MTKINWKSVGDFVGQVCEVALYGVAVITAFRAGKYLTAGIDGPIIASYSDAVGAIMDSSMFSHDKSEAIEALKRHENSDYYGAIVRIAKDSSMFSHDKVKMIKHLSEN